MGKFKENNSAIIKAKSQLASIISELGDCEEDDALEYIKWCLEKSKFYRKSKFKEKIKGLPIAMERGDIVWVNFGINIGDEFSDVKTDGHFAVYWSQNGYQIIVIPISAEDRNPGLNSYAVKLGKLPGLPKQCDSYAKVDMIRSVNLRRIKRIKGETCNKTGKISLKDIYPEGIAKIQKKINEKFVL